MEIRILERRQGRAMNTGKTIYPKAEYFLVWTHIGSGDCWRWIEHKGWETERFMGQVTIISALGGREVLENPLCFGTDRRRCMATKERLNSEHVRNHEPENWRLPTWREAYARTHRRKDSTQA